MQVLTLRSEGQVTCQRAFALVADDRAPDGEISGIMRRLGVKKFGGYADPSALSAAMQTSEHGASGRNAKETKASVQLKSDSDGQGSGDGSEVHHDPKREDNIDLEAKPTSPNDDEAKLPKVADRLSWAIVLVILVGGMERFGYYAATAPWQNYMQNPPGLRPVPGQLGLGQATATTISNAEMIFTALTPIPLAIVSDIYLGRYKTFFISLIFEICGCLIQFATSLQVSISHNARLGGLIAGMVLIGIGAGGVKATFSPFLGDQYSRTNERSMTKKNGKTAQVDYGLTLQLIYQSFYWITNVASLSGIPATFLERLHGFWTTYLLGLVALCLSLAMLIISSPKIRNILVPAGKVMAAAARNGFKLDSTKAEYQIERHGREPSWTDEFVEEMKMTLRTCRILLSFVIFYLCVTQMSNNLISQAGQMQLSGVPNDFIPSIAGIACVLLAPIIQGSYAILARRNIIPSAVLLITLAFILCGGTMAYASGIQHLIYTSPPCFGHPRACGTDAPNNVSVWIQTPMYVIAAFAEIFGFVTVSEYAFKYSPRDAKAIIQALSQLAAGLGSLIGLAISPVAKDPTLVVYYASLSGVMVASAGLFWIAFRKGERKQKEIVSATSG